MQLSELFEQSHPFNYVYPIQNTNDATVIQQVFRWVAEEYGSALPSPDVMITNHEHMQRAARRAKHHTTIVGDVCGWYSQQCDTVFLSDRIRPSRNRKEAAVVAHEFIHYFQFHDGKPNDVAVLEDEADYYASRYLNGR